MRSDADELKHLATEINIVAQAIGFSLREVLKDVRRCGEMLLKAKSLCAHGEWLPWLEKNCPRVGARQAQKYMRLVAKWDEAKVAAVANANPTSYLGIDDMLKILADDRGAGEVEQATAGPLDQDGAGPTPVPFAQRVLSERLADAGSPPNHTASVPVRVVYHPAPTKTTRILIAQPQAADATVAVEPPSDPVLELAPALFNALNVRQEAQSIADDVSDLGRVANAPWNPDQLIHLMQGFKNTAQRLRELATHFDNLTEAAWCSDKLHAIRTSAKTTE